MLGTLPPVLRKEPNDHARMETKHSDLESHSEHSMGKLPCRSNPEKKEPGCHYERNHKRLRTFYSEERQKFASNDEVMRITGKLSNFLSNEIAAMTHDERLFTPRDMENAVYQGIWAAYEAGEIAMKEKAANLASDLWEADDNPCAYPICSEVPAMIRALPLSGAEEATEKTTGG